MLLGMAFGAGGYVALLRQNKKDVNGLGKRLGREVQKLENIIVAVMLIAPEDHKRDVARLLTLKDDNGH